MKRNILAVSKLFSIGIQARSFFLNKTSFYLNKTPLYCLKNYCTFAIYGLLLFLYAQNALFAGIPNLTRNDPFTMYSSVYPYSFLADKQKANLMHFRYSYPENRFRISVSGYKQFARTARDSEKNAINLGDINGRWNMLGLFYDKKLRDVLYRALGINPAAIPNSPEDPCVSLIQDPRFVDPNQEFGFFSIPMNYDKYGVRFESEILLLNECYYAVGLRVLWGISDIRQTVLRFEDFTCQALGIACPANSTRGVVTGSTTTPPPFTPVPGITPPFVSPVSQPPCFQTGPCNPDGNLECVPPLQPFEPCANEKVCFSFTGECKQIVIEDIMNQRDKIFKILGLDACSYHKTGLDDLILNLYWRHIFIINEHNECYPRVLFMPFAEAGVGIPMTREINNSDMFAIPFGNNHHTYVTGRAGYTIDFLDTIDLTFTGGFSYFFKREYCNFRMPTNPAESGIFPYSADVEIRPGPTWYFSVGMHAYHFLCNTSFWAEYVVVSHTNDRITVCRSFIPSDSDYFKTGFDVERAECFSKWESQVLNVGFNFDLSDNFAIGALWQAPIIQRNAYRSTTVLGTITFTY